MDETTRILVFTTAFTVTAAILLLVSFSISRRRQLQHKKQLLEQEYRTREEALLQVSRDLHDDVGSSLSGISMLSQLAREELIQHNHASANEILQKINVYTTEVIEKVSDMAWLLKPNQESLSLLIKKLKSYSLASASSKNIRLHFEGEPENTTQEFTIQQRKAIYLVSKEAINNAIKYSLCRNIFYRLKFQNGKVNLQIKDDGKGFAVLEINGGNGLRNMRARADEIGAGFTIQSSPDAGTLITLEF